jgi:hypothetical protein
MFLFYIHTREIYQNVVRYLFYLTDCLIFEDKVVTKATQKS